VRERASCLVPGDDPGQTFVINGRDRPNHGAFQRTMTQPHTVRELICFLHNYPPPCVRYWPMGSPRAARRANAGVFMNRSPLYSRCARFGLGLTVFFACEGLAFGRISAPPPEVTNPIRVASPAAMGARNPAGAEVEPLSGWIGVCRVSRHPRDRARARACPLMMAFSPGDGPERESPVSSLTPPRVQPDNGGSG